MDKCKWEFKNNGEFAKCCDNSYTIPRFISIDFKYCPYCGKRIDRL